MTPAAAIRFARVPRSTVAGSVRQAWGSYMADLFARLPPETRRLERQSSTRGASVGAADSDA